MGQKRKANWVGIVFGVLWLLMAMLVFALYMTGSLGQSFPVPRIIGWVYDLLGVFAGSIVQFIVSVLIIVTSLPKKGRAVAAAEAVREPEE